MFFLYTEIARERTLLDVFIHITALNSVCKGESFHEDDSYHFRVQSVS